MIPQVKQWTHAEQVSHFISFSITGRVAVGCAPASQLRKASSEGEVWLLNHSPVEQRSKGSTPDETQ